MKPIVYWFKSDLRLHDNAALHLALSSERPIAFVYVWDSNQEKRTRWDTLKMGVHRKKFLLECLSELQQQLQLLQSDLHLLEGPAEKTILEFCQAHQIDTVFTQNEFFSEEKSTLKKTHHALKAHQISLHNVGDRTLLRELDLPFPINQLPDSFTPFRHKVESSWKIADLYPSPTKIKVHHLAATQAAEIKTPIVLQDNRTAIPFFGGEKQGLKRLEQYLFESHGISRYKETRNGLVGSEYSSKFSLWLAHGALSPRMIYHQVKAYEQKHGGNESTYWMIFELLWRDYFHFAMQKTGNQLFQWAGLQSPRCAPIPLNKDKWENWKNGTTGQPFIDANMRELKATGFMSNRGRQNVASFWVHEYAQDWRYGAAHFEEQLIDYDPASNWGNWAYLAGVGHDPRGWRQFNIAKQAQQYDPDDKYQDLWLTE